MVDPRASAPPSSFALAQLPERPALDRLQMIQYFVETVRLGGFSRADGALGVGCRSHAR